MTPQHHPLAGAVLEYEHGRALARHIFLAVMAELDVRRAMLCKLRFSDGVLMAGEEVVPVTKPPYVIAFGKAATRMAESLREILGGEIAAGVIVAPAAVAPGRKLDRFVYYEAGHPYPTHGSLDGAGAALELVSGLTPDDLVIFLVSGGGSALFEKPLGNEITLADLIEFNRILVTGDLPIERINVLRKHISAVKGGRLAEAAFPARQFTIYISDVPGEFPSMVASGPTFADESTLDQCYELAERNGLAAKFPPRIRKQFERRSLEETPKPGNELFSRSGYFCLLSNGDAVDAARGFAAEAGFHAEIESGVWDADYKQVAEQSLSSLAECAQAHPGKPVCLVMGGEVTCPVTGRGVGGRNLSFALYAAQKIEGQKRVALSCATDGRDGNSPSCGAVADGHAVSRARARGLDAGKYLRESDAYHFFRALGETIETGFTDNNVRDLRLLMSFE
ncbi:MAG: glycerate kinase type-2 family protein [Terriglobia bacterium]